ncbi:MAG: hypothetical protein LBM63_02990 [Rikenellaceae bacterium]|jgi:hypothetical protein|nr:hypothetical protein [Rikenellaceae bacterium]
MEGLLITPAQVAELAFRAPDFISPDTIGEATILATQQKFIAPVFGGLYQRLCEGAYPDFTEEYVVAPLALYVKMQMLPQLAVQAGGGGVVEVTSKNLARVGDAKLRLAVRRLRSDAAALIDRAIDHIEASPEAFPEYDPRENILNHTSIDGGIIL